MKTLLVLGIVGAIAQLIDGSLGMAYGVTSTTLLVAAGIAPAAASASVHFAEIGTTLASGVSHHRLGNVDWRIVRILAVPGALGAFAGATILSSLPADVAKPVVEILAAIPSVAYGFFAVLVLAPWMQKRFGFSTGTNALNASVILAIMALPTIISVAEDAISALGRELREASYSLGATRLETMVKVVIPAAHSGIIAAVVLGMMRAIGETMVVWMASGNATQIPHPWWDLSQSIRTMTATIAGEMGEAPEGMPHRSALFAVGVVLLLMTFMLNIVSEYFLSRAKKAAGKS